MGGRLSCVSSPESNSKGVKVKGNRPSEYVEISDDFLASDRSSASQNGDDNGFASHSARQANATDVEELYENSSSIMEASSTPPSESPPPRPSSNGKPAFKPSANERREGVASTPIAKLPPVPKTGRAKLPKRTKTSPVAEDSRPPGRIGGKEPHHQQGGSPAFRVENSSATGHYQNVQLSSPTAAKSAPSPNLKPARQEEVVDDGEPLYTQVQKPKIKKASNINAPQLNYVEVEFLPSATKDSKTAINNNKKKPQLPQPTYSDVIEKDGKIVIVTS